MEDQPQLVRQQQKILYVDFNSNDARKSKKASISKHVYQHKKERQQQQEFWKHQEGKHSRVTNSSRNLSNFMVDRKVGTPTATATSATAGRTAA